MDEWSQYFFNKITKYNIDSKILSTNKNITENTIDNNKDYKWHIGGLCENISLSYKYLENIIKNDKIDYTEGQLRYYKSNIYKNPSCTIEDVLKNINDPEYNIHYFSLNPNIRIDIIEKYLDFKWNYYYLSSNTNITVDYILNNIDLG